MTLDTLAAWRERSLPNAAWAARYGGNYRDIIAFLGESLDAARRRKRRVRLAGVAVILAVLGVVSGITFLFTAFEAEKQAMVAKQEVSAAAQADARRNLLSSFIGKIADKIAYHQEEGKWHLAWNLLAYFTRQIPLTVRNDPSLVDPSAAKAVYLRMLSERTSVISSNSEHQFFGTQRSHR